MSETARDAFATRQRWALPGSPHDKLVGTLKVGLPIGIGILAAFLVTAPLASGGDVSFVLDKHKVDVAHERLRIQEAEYRGEDGKGQPFILTAHEAKQKSSAEPIVNIGGLTAKLQLADGPAHLTADHGRHDMAREQVEVDGPIKVDGPRGYTLTTQNATLDMKRRTLASQSAVSGTVTAGRYSADRLHADLDNRTVTLDGHAHLRIVPRRTR